jgi:uncharacterized SAM-binding protein YcdF (DUF218 family)
MALGLCLLFYQPLLKAYGLWLTPISADPTADIAVSLGEGARRAQAIDLYQTGQVNAIYVDALPYRDVEAIQQNYHLPDQAILWGGCLVFTTFEQATAFRDTISNAPPPQSLVLVSDPFHLRRSRWTFRRVLGPGIVIKTAAAPELPPAMYRHWWRHQPARQWVSSETQKILFYWLYYGLLGRNVSKDIPFNDIFEFDLESASPEFIRQRCRD